MSGEIWSEWRIHDGKGCPCVGEYVQFVIGVSPEGFDPATDEHRPDPHERRVGPCVYESIAKENGSWTWNRHCYPIIQYRIRKPRGLATLEDLIADIPAPSKPGVKA